MILINFIKKVFLILVYTITFKCQIEINEVDWQSISKSPLHFSQGSPSKYQKGKEFLGFSIWLKIKRQINLYHPQDILNLLGKNQDELSIQIRQNGLQYQILANYIKNNKKQTEFLVVQADEWFLLILSVQRKIILSILPSTSNWQQQLAIFDQIQNIILLSPNNQQFLTSKEFIIYKYNQKTREDKLLLQIFNYAIKQSVCEDISEQREFDANCFFFNLPNEANVSKNDSKLIEQLILNRNVEINCIIFSFYIKYQHEGQLSSLSILKVDNLIEVTLSNYQQQFQLKLIINDEEYNLGYLEGYESYITIQIEDFGDSQQKVYSYYNNSHLKQIQEISQKNKILNREPEKIHIQHSWLLILTNYRIDFEKSLINNCFIQVSHIINNYDKRCILRDINLEKVILQAGEWSTTAGYKQFKVSKKNPAVTPSLQSIQHISDNNNKTQKRILQATTYLHGNNMLSLLRNFYVGSQKTIILSDLTTTYLVFGYFKQSTFQNNSKYPVITIGQPSDNQFFLNLFYDSSSSVKLKYINKAIIDSQIFSYSLAGDASNKWIGLGIGYSSSLKIARIYYAGTSNGQETSLITPSNQFTGITFNSLSQLEICFACKIGELNYKIFNGEISTVKIVYDIDINSNNPFNLFRENLTKQALILNSIDLNNYVPNSEYDLGQGFQCNTTYAFFEGVCIQKDNCKNIVLQNNENWQFESGKFYDDSTKKCLTCMSDCMICTSLSICTQCRNGYKLVSNKCVRCDEVNICNQTCSGDSKFDYLNQICSNNFDVSTHQLSSSQLLSSRFFTETQDLTITPTLPSTQYITHCYIDANNNPYTLLSFLGSTYFTSSTVLKKSFTNIPNGYMKTIQFYALFYGNGQPTNLLVNINSKAAQMNTNYITLVSNSKTCLNSGDLNQSIFKVEFQLMDYKSILDLEIRSTVDKWAIRNMNIIISKCHYTCNTCYEGGTAGDCATCSAESFLSANKYSCTCSSGYYLQYISNCYSPPCVKCKQCAISNCTKCQDQTGNCVLCENGYSEIDGQCSLNSLLTSTYYYQIINNKFQQKIRDSFKDLSQSDHNFRFVDLWQFSNGDTTSYFCKYPSYNLLKNNEYLYLKLDTSQHEIYHYNIAINYEITAIGNLNDSLNDHLEVSCNGQIILNEQYGQKLQNSGGKYDSCAFPNFKEYYFHYGHYQALPLNMLEFKIQAFFSDSTSKAFSSCSFYTDFIRCNPLCKSCSAQGDNNCTECIVNAEKQNNICQCKDGFAFVHNNFPKKGEFPGKCLPCHPSCQTCSEISFYECLVCRDGYIKVSGSNICQYRCSDGNYWDSNSSICMQCHQCCRTCYSSGINACHDCNSNYSLDIASHTCRHSIYNQSCQLPCSMVANNYCGGSQSSHSSCINSGWYKIDSTVCLNCGNYAAGSCGGDQSMEVAKACQQVGYFNYNNSNCAFCINFVSGKCGGDQTQEVIETCKSYGYFQVGNTDKCSSCRFVNSSDSSCGINEIKDTCYNNNWTKLNNVDCIYCGNYDTLTSSCGGVNPNTETRQKCQDDGYIDSGNNKCSSCKFLNGSECGVNSIKSNCLLKNWIKFNNSDCIYCGNYDTLTSSCAGANSNSEMKQKCQDDGYRDSGNSKCSSCKFLNGSDCGNTQIKQQCIESGYVQVGSTANCSSCKFANSSGLGCGINEIKDSCLNNNWTKFNNTDCIYCGNYDTLTSSCGGVNPNSEMRQKCLDDGYRDSGNSKCSSCKFLIGSDCGSTQIMASCKDGWTKLKSQSYCIKCYKFVNGKCGGESQEIIDTCIENGYVQVGSTTQCSSCKYANSSGSGCGINEIKNSCYNNNWTKLNNAECIYCGNYDTLSSSCAGVNSNSETKQKCLDDGYIDSGNNKCSSCKFLNGSECGVNSIKSNCLLKNWIKFNNSDCIYCGNYDTLTSSCAGANSNSEMKQKCQDDGYRDSGNSKCSSCKFLNGSDCGNTQIKQQCIESGYVQVGSTANCSSCKFANSSGLGCGINEIKDSCQSNNWTKFNNTDCIYCGKYDSSGCGGVNLNSEMRQTCVDDGFRDSGNSKCSSCKFLIGSDCGSTQIMASCKDGWTKLKSQSYCIKCYKFVNGKCGGETQDIIDTCIENGYVQVGSTTQCSSCKYANSSGSGCGINEIKDSCYNNNWIKFNNTDCIYCGNYDTLSSSCAGVNSNSEMRQKCLDDGYKDSGNNKCSSCKFLNGSVCGNTQIKASCIESGYVQVGSTTKCSSCRFANSSGFGCGINEIKDSCFKNDWIEFNNTDCIYCGNNDASGCGGGNPSFEMRKKCIDDGYFNTNNNNKCSSCKFLNVNGSECGADNIKSICPQKNWVKYNSSVCISCGTFQVYCGGNYLNYPDAKDTCLKFGFMKDNDGNCNSCRFASGTSCGKNGIDKNCYSNNWIFQQNSTNCVYCGNFIDGQCGGDQPEDIKKICIQGGYFNYNVNNTNYCSTCRDLNGSNCGRNEIKDQCKQSKWIKNDSNICMFCSQKSETKDLCKCHDSCLKCDENYFNPNGCTSCISSKVFFFNQCLDQCPETYSPNSNNVCVLTCSLIINSECGGSANCATSGWEKLKDSTGCVKCTQYNSEKNNCGQDQAENTIEACIQGGYYKQNNTTCSTCKELKSNQCGKTEINQACKDNGWKYDLNSSCVNCSENSWTIDKCSCHPNCKECGEKKKYFDEKGCSICNGDLKFYLNQCLTKCPEKYSPNDQNKCVLTCSLISNSLCGGSEDCGNNGWEQKDSKECVYCGNYQNLNCGGDQNEKVIIDLCQQTGYKNYNSNQCSSCKIANKSDCGNDNFKEICFRDKWRKYNPTSCINCNINSCKCDPTCNECGDLYFDPKSCNSCSSTLLYFNKQCLTKCPNGYTPDSIGKNCIECEDKQMPTCFNCHKTCQICSPFQVSNNPNSCISCSTTRDLILGECKCKDTEDKRDIMFFECSHNEIAVIEPILSNSKPQLEINFGKKLSVPSDNELNAAQIDLCQFIFEQDTLDLFGTKHLCSISSTFIIVEFDENNSNIFNGDYIHLHNGRLSYYNTSDIKITKFYNNVVVQQKLQGDSKVIFNYVTNPNYCDDISLTYIKLVNSGGRNFQSFKWVISSYTKQDSPEYLMLNSLLEKYTSEKKLDIFIPKGTIKPDIKVVIRLVFTLKVNVATYEDFPIQVKIEKQLYLDIDTQITSPFYKFQSGILSIKSNVVQCDPSGNTNIPEAINFNINCDQFKNFSYSNSSYLEKERIINVEPFKLPAKNITIIVSASLVSNEFIKGEISFTIEVQQSKLRTKIIGGNGYFNYNKQIEIFGKVRDPDLPTEEEPQEISISWQCIDPGTKEPCANEQKELIKFEYNEKQNSIMFKPGTFKPYTAAKIELKGEKPTDRVSIDFVVIMFSELDLPPLGVKVQSSDPDSNTVNLNEEIQIVLNYNTQVNVDLLSFSGTIVYENDVVGLIKFDYYTLRFQIWNYYSGFKRENPSFQVRFNIFNPQYYMPSVSLIPLKINFPPSSCKFSVNQDSNIGYSLETRYMLLMESCLDENKPIKYQFFFYKSQEDFESEKRNPQQVKRRQITDKQYGNNVIASLPSGKLLLMAQAIDSKQAIYNTTYPIEVQSKQYDESSYLKLIQKKLDSSNNISTESAIFELSILSDDILEKNQFKQSTSLNLKKIEIQNQLTSLSKLLPLLSTFATLSDKAISSLNQSGISYSSSESINFINDLMKQLDQSLSDQVFNVDILKEKLKQRLYDNFQILDSLSNQEITKIQDKSSQDKLLHLQEQISSYLLKNVLPNEDPKVFQGSSSQILSNQVTEKYICTYFMCDNLNNQPSNNENSNNKQPKIYNVKMISQNQNFYTSDSSYQNYTNNLKIQSPNLTISQYPVITPSIKSDQEQPVLEFQKKVALTFQAKGENQKPMACLTKSKVGWTQSGCKNLFDPDSKTFTCICNKLSPTTIIEDLELLGDNNLDVAFGSEGLDNISHFDNFYDYGVFWTLLIYSVCCIYLIYKGWALDKLVTKIIPSSPLTTGIENLNLKRQRLSAKNSSERNIDSKMKLSSEKQFSSFKNINQKTDQNINDSPLCVLTDTPILEQIDSLEEENLNASKEVYKKRPRKSEKKPSFFSTQQKLGIQKKVVQEEKNQEKNIDIKEISEKDFIKDLNKNNQVLKINEHGKQQLIEDQNIKTINLDLENQSKNLDQIKQDQDNQNEDKKQKFLKSYEKIQNLKMYKKILLFHNFLSIFYIYNPKLSRSLRFLIFYVRIVHSMSISVIFDKQYNITQKIIIALINAITLAIVIKIFERSFLIKQNVVKIISRIVILSFIGGYLYIILSIVSGQTPSQSNTFIATLVCIQVVDLVIVSSFIAFVFQWVASVILEFQSIKSQSTGWMKVLQNIIEIENIISYLFKNMI